MSSSKAAPVLILGPAEMLILVLGEDCWLKADVRRVKVKREEMLTCLALPTQKVR